MEYRRLWSQLELGHVRTCKENTKVVVCKVTQNNTRNVIYLKVALSAHLHMLDHLWCQRALELELPKVLG